IPAFPCRRRRAWLLHGPPEPQAGGRILTQGISSGSFRPSVVVEEDPVGGTVEIVELARFECPEKGAETDETQAESDGNQHQEDGHTILARLSRKALRITTIDELDMAIAATSGVT